ncbi:RloB family protein [Thermomonospora catenispora]|uniref:RloB family protein n=1 Tax=Thermomonospora catenispora TaxID=2493090 RepID=UPI001F4F4A85|nr:RloB family protein [Thermomonospora catenispora]
MVVCEGTVTEKRYLDGLKDHLRAIPVDVVEYDCVGKGRDPHSTVELAVRLRDQARQRARAQQDAFLAYDAVWCVVDVDDHATLHSALSLARRENVNLVVSNPCFEVWLLVDAMKRSGKAGDQSPPSRSPSSSR